MGYFVGKSKKFPNPLSKDLFERAKRKREKGVVIKKCPKKGCQGKVVLKVDEERLRILHHCLKCKSDYLFYFTDEEIYRFLPTFIVSTVDKHAAFAGQRKYRNLVGGRLAECRRGHGFIPFGDK